MLTINNAILKYIVLLALTLIIINHQSYVVLANHDNININNSNDTNKMLVDVGVILDLETIMGKRSLTSISMALHDFYSLHHNYKTRIVLHLRDSKEDVIEATAAAVDLVKNKQVKAIIGPGSSTGADFLVNLAVRSQVPLVSYAATSPSLCPKRNPYFIRTAFNDSSQVPAISATIHQLGWREAVLVYEDSGFGCGIIPDLINALQGQDIRVTHRTIIAPMATAVELWRRLVELKNMECRVFVVHLPPLRAADLLLIANELGMMSDGYAWIVTYATTVALDNLLINRTATMDGVLGFRPMVDWTPAVEEFSSRFVEKFRWDYGDDEAAKPSLYQLWAYDTVWAVAMAVERVSTVSSGFTSAHVRQGTTDLLKLGIYESGPELLEEIRSVKFEGLSGMFKLVSGQFRASVFEIINVVRGAVDVVGFWTPEGGVMRQEMPRSQKGLKQISWPGGSQNVPKGWEIPTKGKKLRIGVPVKHGFTQFVKVEMTNNVMNVTGYCIEMFEAVVRLMPYDLSFEYIPYNRSSYSYSSLVHEVHLKNFDAVVGDVTIIADRAKNVDYTMPYTDSGVSMIVAIQQKDKNIAWVFLKPWTIELWLGTFAFFIFTSLVLWLMELENNAMKSPTEQLCTSFYFVFSVLVFAHKEDLKNNLSRIAIVIWVFVVLILTSSYTASLTSTLTANQLQPTVTDVKQLLRTKAHVGIQSGSFVAGMLARMGFKDYQLRSYNTMEQYAEALLKGTTNGGVDAIFDEIPYLKIFLADRCSQFTMVGLTYKTDGFGFVFPRDSPLVPDVSRAILNLTEDNTIRSIETKWFGNPEKYPSENTNSPSTNLTLQSFKGLFIITGAASGFAFILFLITYSYTQREPLKRAMSHERSVSRKILAVCKYYHDSEPPTPKENELHGDGEATVDTDTSTMSMTPRASTSNSSMS